MNTMDMETVLLSGLMAVIGALGCVMWFAAFTGMRFYECNMAVTTGAFITLGGIFWGILLIFNRNKPSKQR